MSDTRRPISLLPLIHQTDPLKKFFGSTVDQLFKSGKTASVSGYIGRKPQQYDPLKDFYKLEPTENRSRFQLESAMVSAGEGGEIYSKLFYDDLLSSLHAQGAIVNNPDRLFKSEYWAWAPPVDIDKINNFQRYYWSDDSVPSVIITLAGMDVPTVTTADGSNTQFPLPVAQPLWNLMVSDRIQQIEGNEGEYFDGAPAVLVNGVREWDFIITDQDTIELRDAPEADSVVEVYRYGNIGNGARTDFPVPSPINDLVASDSEIYVFVSGNEIHDFTVMGGFVRLNTAPATNTHVVVTRHRDLRSVIEGDESFAISQLTAQPVEELLNGLRVHIIDPQSYFIGFAVKPYATHKWDERRDDTYIVDGVGSEISLTALNTSIEGMDPQYVVISRVDGAKSKFSRFNRWVDRRALEWFGGAVISRQAQRPICEYVANLRLFNYGTQRAPDADIFYGVTKRFTALRQEDDFGNLPQAGDIVFYGNRNTPDDRKNKFFVWPTVDEFTLPSEVIFEAFHEAEIGDVSLHTMSGTEYQMTARGWVQCASYETFPLFDLFDGEGVSLSNETRYPQTTFAGSRIFGFRVGFGNTDPVLGFPVDYDTYGAIMFDNYQYGEKHHYRDGPLDGYSYYLIGENDFGNQWHLSEKLLPSVGAESVPLNLSANPNMGTPLEISRNTWFAHFSSIVANQEGFEGQTYSDNNWPYTARDLSLGTQIVQPKSPMLKLMLIMAEKSLSMKDAISFIETEYRRYKLKVVRVVGEMLNQGLLHDAMVDDDEIVKIFQSITSNRTSEFTFFHSDIGRGQFFIPVSTALAGVTPMVKPHIIDEFGLRFIVGHDGSKTACTDPLVDRLILAMENRMFSTESEVYRPEEARRIDRFDLFSGKFRNADYTLEECNAIMQREFEDWARTNNVDYKTNSTFDENNPFTWNYRSLNDIDGNPIAGNWRGIYRWYFDTETPNLTPWEMLGFAEKPLWWDARYGTAPYTRNNIQLWGDLERGYIHAGPRQGIDERFVRPNIMEILPVDTSGNLLDPVEARIVDREPTVQIAQEPWTFGDVSPVESLWRRSSSYCFAEAKTLFLMRPAQFVEEYWDQGDLVLVHGDQWVSRRLGRRAAHDQLAVHGEDNPDGTFYRSHGIQSWISEHMAFNGQTPAFLGMLVRGLDVRLAHKMAGFTTPDRLVVEAESFGRIPSENISVELYATPSLAVDHYSGVIIEALSSSRWRVYGYNSSDPYFTIEPSDRGGRRYLVVGNEERVVNPWHPNVYYKAGVFVLHEGFLYEAIRNHTSSSRFEQSFWRQDVAFSETSEKIWRYEDGLGHSERIPYTEVFTSRQDVVDFLYSYERSLESRGFGFPEGSFDDAVVRFIHWSSVRWTNGAFLTLSPAARNLTYRCDQGYVLDLNNGAVVNRTGHRIDSRKMKVDRFDGELTIEATGDDVYGVTINIAEAEHALFFENRTIFNDIICDTLLNVRQDRLWIDARRTEGWTGRYDAAGFIISDGQIVTNFEKTTEDLRYMFDIELADNTILRDHARHVIGFEQREYLSNLRLNETQQFEFYQGMIQHKGSRGALDKLLRSESVDGNRGLEFLEEWAFRMGEFGAYNSRGFVDVILNHADLRRQIQPFRLGSPNILLGDKNIVAIPDDSNRWVSPVMKFDEIMEDNLHNRVKGLPDAGYVRTDEATYMAPDLARFNVQVRDALAAGKTFSEGETVWLYTNEMDGRWQFKHIVSASNEAVAFDGEIDEIVSNDHWSYVNRAPLENVNFFPNGQVDSSGLAISGSEFKLADPEVARQIIGEDAAIYVAGDNTTIMAGTYLYSTIFPVDAGETFTAAMKTVVEKGFNGATYMSVRWFKEDAETLSDVEPITVMNFYDHRRPTDEAPAFQREDNRPQIIIAPSDAAFGEIRIAVEFPNTLAVNRPATGRVVIATPTLRRVNNYTTRIDNSQSDASIMGTRMTTEHPHGLLVGEYAFVGGPTADSLEGVGATMVVDTGVDEDGYHWFELDLPDQSVPSYNYALVGDIGPQIFRLVDARFRVRKEAIEFPLADGLIFVDDSENGSDFVADADHSERRWAVYRRVNPTNYRGSLVREQPEYVNTHRIGSTLIYDRDTKITETAISPLPLNFERVTPIDPMLGIIAGVADKEIDYKLEYNPAVFQGGDGIWGEEQIGQLWWDLSTVWFLNPYTDIVPDDNNYVLNLGDGDVFSDAPAPNDAAFALEPLGDKGRRYLEEIRYRVNHWGRLAQGSSVDIYEWTKSYTIPDPKRDDLHPEYQFVKGVEYMGTLGREVEVYYFWVRNPSITPNRQGRKLDAAACAAIIANPSAQEIPWMAVIARREFLVSGVREYLGDNSTVFQIQLQLTDLQEDVPHTKWKLMRPRDERSLPEDMFVEKLRDSLAGFDDNLQARPSPLLHPLARTGIQPRQAMFDSTQRTAARESFITMLNYQLARHNYADNRTFYPNELNLSTPIPEYLIWSQPVGERTIANLPPTSLYSTDRLGSPLRTSDPVRLDEWMRDYPMGTRVLMDNRHSGSPSWSVWEKKALPDVEDGYTVEIAKHYDFAVEDNNEFDVLVDSGEVAAGQHVLIRQNADFDGFWTVIRFTQTDEIDFDLIDSNHEDEDDEDDEDNGGDPE